MQPISSKTAPKSTIQQGGIFGFPISAPATAEPAGTKAPKLRSLTAAESGESPFTVENRCGICATPTYSTTPARKVFLQNATSDLKSLVSTDE
jgi:hypothetical protein